MQPYLPRSLDRLGEFGFLVDILSLFYALRLEKADELPTFQGFMI
ncbi:DNA mismatch repair protein MutS [Streptococcus sanguinis SK1058]|nr:DNA mismatch repair protein MutS [Streptococcus sanguinis SK1058]